MKNISKRLATIAGALALVVVLGIALAACGSSALSVGDYAQNLTNKGYDINITTNTKQVEYMLLMVDFTEEEIKDIKIEWAMNASYEDEDENDIYVVIAKFGTEDSAKAVEEKFKAYLESMYADDDADANAVDTDASEQQVVVRNGSVVMVGHQAAINAAQGK